MLTFYTFRFPRYRPGKILLIKVTTARSKVKSMSHHDVAHLHPLVSVPTKYHIPTHYSFQDTAHPNIHLDTIDENNTWTALKGCGVKTKWIRFFSGSLKLHHRCLYPTGWVSSVGHHEIRRISEQCKLCKGAAEIILKSWEIYVKRKYQNNAIQ